MIFKDEQFFILVKRFLTMYLPKQKCYSDNTIKSYTLSINLFLDFLRDEKETPLQKVCFAEIDHYVIAEFLDWLTQARGCGNSTRNQRLNALRSFLKFAAFENPSLTAIYMEADKVPKAKTVQAAVEFMSHTAMQALLRQPDVTAPRGVRDRFLMILLYDTGARISEIMNLRLRDISASDNQPHVYLIGKGSKPRIVPLMEKTKAHFTQYLDLFHPQGIRNTNDYLFYTIIHNHKNRMSADNAASFISRYADQARQHCKEIPPKVHPHMFRHTRAMDLYRGGMPLPLVQQFLGHSEMKTTLVYAFADTEMKRKAILKADPDNICNAEAPVWIDDEQLLRKLYGLR